MFWTIVIFAVDSVVAKINDNNWLGGCPMLSVSAECCNGLCGLAWQSLIKLQTRCFSSCGLSFVTTGGHCGRQKSLLMA